MYITSIFSTFCFGKLSGFGMPHLLVICFAQICSFKCERLQQNAQPKLMENIRLINIK